LKLTLLLALLAVSSAAANPPGVAEPSAEPAPPPVLTAVATELDAGEVVEGTEVRLTFTLVNQGEAPLNLKVMTSCGCTVARFEPSIAAGARNSLDVTMKTRGLRGRLTKALQVIADDPKHTQVGLRVLVTVVPLVRVEPGFAAYLPVQDQGPTQTEFTLTPAPGKKVQFTEVVSTIPYVQARLLPATSLDGPRKLQVSITPDAPLGHLQATIAVVTDSEVTPRIRLTITGEKGIGVSPSAVFLGLIPENSTSAHEEVLLTKSGGQFAIKSAASDDPSVRVAVEPVKEGSRYRLVATYTGGRKIGLLKQMITVTTDDPRQPVLKIPVEGVISEPKAADAPRPPVF
jgi:hypothetical protein